MTTLTLPLLKHAPKAGEQYRFHFDMSKCIGCKCCVVACNEQNGNPAEINWRQVGELEGGIFPSTQRLHLSMGCNHCVEPTCLSGCPVEAYTKDAATGIVDHNADQCIGCQYCTWNCSYGVPQYNEARGVVGKCDLCHRRLNEGLDPACATACPEGAIAIEIVNIAEWMANYSSANAPGMPDASDSISTTRISLPSNIAPDLARVDLERRPVESSHWSLVVVLVLMQWAAGGAAFGLAPIYVMGLILLGLAIAPLHLGRPLYAYRAWMGWRSSWLSREVIAFGVFAQLAALGVAFESFRIASAAAGLMATYCSARIYMVKARPGWNSPYTLLDFFGTVVLLGATLVAPWAAAAAMLSQLAIGVWRGRTSISRLAFGAFALASLPYEPRLSLCFAVLGELTGRGLFFSKSDSKSVASSFLTPGGTCN